MTDADYAVYLKNTPAQDEFQLHSPKQAAEGICFYVNENKRKFVFLTKRAISTLRLAEYCRISKD